MFSTDKELVQHVLDRMQCLEPNNPPPPQDIIDYIKSVLDIKKLDYTKKNIKLYLFGEERWHLIYVWCVLNNIPFLTVPERHQRLILEIFEDEEIPWFCECRKQRQNMEITILELIGIREEFEYLKPYLRQNNPEISKRNAKNRCSCLKVVYNTLKIIS